MTSKPITTYKDAGVDIDRGDEFVDVIGPLTKKTSRPEVITGLGGYAGLFALNAGRFREPVLVSSTDGVGTKLKLAFEMEYFEGVGVDLVAMSVNDILCCGAEPLFFLDYFATSKLEVGVAQRVLKGICTALEDINCALLGGETAEMPGLYQKGEFDLAGFVVGVAEKSRLIDGSRVQAGDAVIGLASSGVHSNGFSLVREILRRNNIDPKKDFLDFDRPIGQVLLEPTRIYVNEVLSLLKTYDLRGIAHITGGGLLENIPRVIPDNLAVEIQTAQVTTPRLFTLLKELGNVPDAEMWRVFNMGVGMVLIAPQNEVVGILAEMARTRTPANVIGTVVSRKNPQQGVVLV